MLAASLALAVLTALAPAGATPKKGFSPSNPTAPQGQKRVALVIGNGGYKNAPLINPRRDAKAVARALKTVGFEVEVLFDVDREGMLRALKRFAARLDPDSVALFYFSGHGLTQDGSSFMLPTAASIRTAADIELEAVDLRRVTARLEEAGSRLNLVILDACRNNPLAYANQRSAGGGLAFISAPSGTLIAYATAPGQTAADGRGDLSPYTAAFVEELAVPGRPVEEVFKAVRRRVREDSNGAQVPWESSSLEGRFVFHPTGFKPTLPGEKRDGQETDARDPGGPAHRAEDSSSRVPLDDEDDLDEDDRDEAWPRRQRQRDEEEAARPMTEAEEVASLEERFAKLTRSTDNALTTLYLAGGLSAGLTAIFAGSVGATLLVFAAQSTSPPLLDPTQAGYAAVPIVSAILLSPLTMTGLFLTTLCGCYTANLAFNRNKVEALLVEKGAPPPAKAAMAY